MAHESTNAEESTAAGLSTGQFRSQMFNFFISVNKVVRFRINRVAWQKRLYRSPRLSSCFFLCVVVSFCPIAYVVLLYNKLYNKSTTNHIKSLSKRLSTTVATY